MNFFRCGLFCSPEQGNFVNVTSTKDNDGQSIVNGLTFSVNRVYAEAIFSSCRGVHVSGGARTVQDIFESYDVCYFFLFFFYFFFFFLIFYFLFNIINFWYFDIFFCFFYFFYFFYYFYFLKFLVDILFLFFSIVSIFLFIYLFCIILYFFNFIS